MSVLSSIEWTDASWNPTRGCTKISPGCIHCYAETFAERFRGVPGHPYEQGFDLRLVPEKLAEPLIGAGWSVPKKVFVNSMSDLFHKDIPDEYIESVCKVMQSANWHTYQLLTKRADRLAELLSGRLFPYATLQHAWWGVSVENRKHGLPRIDALRSAPEPLLEDLGEVDLTGIDWVIVGGESGHGARPMEQAWVERLRDQCEAAGVKFFFKQWGGVQKSKTGRLLDGRTHDEMPEILPVAVPSKKERIKLAEALGLATLKRTSLVLAAEGCVS